MVTPENARPGVFGISAPPVETPVRPVVLPKPEVKPALKPTPPPEKPKEMKMKLPPSKKAAALRITGAVAAAAGTVGPAVDHHVNYETQITPPAIGRDVASIPGFYWDLGKSAVDSVNSMFNSIKGSRSAEKPSETVAPFDNAKLDTERQTIVFGKNAREATPEIIQPFLNAPLPEIKPKSEIKTPADLPTITIPLPIDIQKAGKVKIQRNLLVPEAGPLRGQEVPSNVDLILENQNAPIGLFIPLEYMKNIDSTEIFLMTPTKTADEVSVAMFYEKFNLGDGKYIISEVYTGGIAGAPNAKATDLVKNATVIDPNRPNGDYIKDILQNTGTKINTQDKSTLFTTKSPNARINVVSWHIDTNNSAHSTILIPTLPTQNGNVLISTPQSN